MWSVLCDKFSHLQTVQEIPKGKMMLKVAGFSQMVVIKRYTVNMDFPIKLTLGKTFISQQIGQL